MLSTPGTVSTVQTLGVGVENTDITSDNLILVHHPSCREYRNNKIAYLTLLILIWLCVLRSRVVLIDKYDGNISQSILTLSRSYEL